MIRRRPASIAALLMCLSGVAHAAVVADFVADFSSTSNPSGAWSYGYTTSLGGSLSLFTNMLDRSGSGDFRYDWNTGPSTPLVGVLIPAASASSGILHPGATGVYADARYTVQSAFTAYLDTAFAIGDATTTDVHVLLNGVSLFDAPIDGATPTQVFQASFAVQAGDTIDFVAGMGSNGSNQFDTTYFTATLSGSPIPEPMTIAVLSVGLGGLSLARRRRVASQ